MRAATTCSTTACPTSAPCATARRSPASRTSGKRSAARPPAAQNSAGIGRCTTASMPPAPKATSRARTTFDRLRVGARASATATSLKASTTRSGATATSSICCPMRFIPGVTAVLTAAGGPCRKTASSTRMMSTPSLPTPRSRISVATGNRPTHGIAFAAWDSGNSCRTFPPRALRARSSARGTSMPCRADWPRWRLANRRKSSSRSTLPMPRPA